MELDRFLDSLRELHGEISCKAEVLENDRKKGFQGMPGLIQKLSALMPEWLYFIEQTEIGEKEDLLLILRDMEDAMCQEDSVLLADALLFGLQAKAGAYIRIMEEALSDEK